jgi:hypothetical protein
MPKARRWALLSHAEPGQGRCCTMLTLTYLDLGLIWIVLWALQRPLRRFSQPCCTFVDLLLWLCGSLWFAADRWSWQTLTDESLECLRFDTRFDTRFAVDPHSVSVSGQWLTPASPRGQRGVAYCGFAKSVPTTSHNLQIRSLRSLWHSLRSLSRPSARSRIAASSRLSSVSCGPLCTVKRWWKWDILCFVHGVIP